MTKKYKDLRGYYLRESLIEEFRQIFNELELNYSEEVIIDGKNK